MLLSARRWLRSRQLPILIPVIILLNFILLLMKTRLLELLQKHFLAGEQLKIIDSEIHCYRDHTLETLPDISDNLEPPDAGNSIFFHETSCRSFNNGRIIISGRQACAVESAALLHPRRKVYLLFTSPGQIKSGIGDESDLALTALQSYGNIRLGHVDFAKYITNTPVEHLYTSGSLELSKYSMIHASDVIKLLTLWKYGGVYLDLDVVVTKSFDDLGANFAGRESSQRVANGVLGLSSEGLGHIWATKCLDDLNKTFNGTKWAYNGPGVITRFLQHLCKVRRVIEIPNNCEGFKVMSPNVFYQIPWWDWKKYFDPKFRELTLKEVENSYAIHVWNKHSHSMKVRKNSAYGIVASKFCPRVYKALQDSKL